MNTRRNRQANPWDEEDVQEASGLPKTALVAGVATAVLAPALLVLAYLPPVGSQHEAHAGVFGQAVTFVVHLVLASGLAAGALGLFLRQAWGWWSAVVFHAADLLYQGKLLLYYVGIINWGHRNAAGLGLEVGVRFALPVAVTLALLVLLFLPSLREMYGVKDRAYHRRRAVGPGARER